MNKIFSLILCFSLVIGPVTVHAETKAMDAYTKVDGTGGKNGIGFYMKQAGLISMAVTGAGMVTCIQGSYHWAHWLFAAGGGVYVVGEIAMAGQKTDYHKKKKEGLEIDDSKLGKPIGVVAQADKDIQTKALEAAKAEEVNNKEMMETRKKWADVVAVIYDLSALSAGIEGILSLLPSYTGFVPDTLVCPGLLPVAVPLGMSLSSIYVVVAGIDQSNGKLGLDTLGFMALLQAEILVAIGVAVPAVITGWGRLAYFGAGAILANVIVEGLQSRINIASTNIEKLNNALCTWGITPSDFTCPGSAGGAAAGGAAGGGDAGFDPVAGGGGGGGGTKPASNYLTKLDSFPNTRGSCIGQSSSGPGIESSPAACHKPLKFTKPQPKFDIPDLASLNQSAFTYADELAKGSAGNQGAIATAGNTLLANAARIRELKEKVINDANKKYMATGGKDLKVAIGEQYKNLMKAFESGAQKSGFGSGSGSAKLATLDPEESKRPSVKPVVVAPTSAGAGGGVPSLSIPSSDLGLTTDATGLTVAEQNSLTTDYENNKGAYLSTEKDSLFQVLSKTYIRNLDRILVRKKTLEEVKPVEKPEE